MIEQEEWRVIDAPFDGYSVSDLGRVKNNKTGYILNCQLKNRSEYPCCTLKRKNCRIHILVAQQFLGYDIEKQKDRKLVIHHKDGNIHNSKLENLEIVTPSKNSKLKAKCQNTDKFGIPILQYDLEGNFIAEYPSAAAFSPNNPNYIRKCIRGKYKTAFGFVWKDKPQQDLDGEVWRESEIGMLVSNMGRLQRPDGIKTFGSARDGRYATYRFHRQYGLLHRLICKTFKPLDNYDNLVVNHINHIKTDNRIKNLEWITQSENLNHFHKENPEHIQRYKQTAIIRIDEHGNEIIYPSAVKAAIENNCDAGNIFCCCNKPTRTTGGYKWKRLAEKEEK